MPLSMKIQPIDFNTSKETMRINSVKLMAKSRLKRNFGIGHSIKDLLEAHTPPGGRLGRGHKGLYDTINNSIHSLISSSRAF